MGMRRNPVNGKMRIDLEGECGNAFWLLAMAQQIALEQGKDGVAIQARMVASDYDDLQKVMLEELGDHVEFAPPPGELCLHEDLAELKDGTVICGGCLRRFEVVKDGDGNDVAMVDKHLAAGPGRRPEEGS